jgi:hypothetical protein
MSLFLSLVDDQRTGVSLRWLGEDLIMATKPCHAHFSLKAVARVTSLVSSSSPRTSWRPSWRSRLAREPWKARPLLHPRYGRVSLVHERPRRLVIGHVLLHGHARDGAAGHVESQGRR